MIEFKIIQTPDKGQIAAYTHPHNELVVGSASGDMIIDDPNLGEQQIQVRPEGAGFVIENLNPDVEVRVSGRTVVDPAPIKSNDTVNMGKTTIHFLHLSQEAASPPSPFQNPQFEARVVEGSKEKAILDALDFLKGGATGATGATKPPMPPRAGGGKPPLPPPLPGKR